MTTHTETPNLDSMTKNELRAYASDPATPGELQDYARLKCRAMTARLQGRIADAVKFEDLADSIYDALPEDLRW